MKIERKLTQDRDPRALPQHHLLRARRLRRAGRGPCLLRQGRRRAGPPEAAYLAGLIRAPEPAQPERNLGVAKTWRHLVLQAMVRDDKITAAQREAVGAADLGVQPLKTQDPAVAHTDIGAQYFVDYVRRQLVNSPRRGRGLRRRAPGADVRSTRPRRSRRTTRCTASRPPVRMRAQDPGRAGRPRRPRPGRRHGRRHQRRTTSR